MPLHSNLIKNEFSTILFIFECYSNLNCKPNVTINQPILRNSSKSLNFRNVDYIYRYYNTLSLNNSWIKVKTLSFANDNTLTMSDLT